MFRRDLELDQLAATYRARRRVWIEGALESEQAIALHEALDELAARDLWYQVTYGSPWGFDDTLSDDDAAVAAFTYRYEKYPVANTTLKRLVGVRGDARRRRYSPALRTADQPQRELPEDHPLRRFGRALCSDDCGRLIARITDHRVVPEATVCFASRYMPGDYNGPHDDQSTARLVAFVLYLVPRWLAHWGGQLVILDPTWRRIEDSYMPCFNALLLFDVPLAHAVVPVAPFCPRPRYALTGWFHSG